LQLLTDFNVISFTAFSIDSFIVDPNTLISSLILLELRSWPNLGMSTFIEKIRTAIIRGFCRKNF
jgi:hypothetical protein